MDTVEPDIKALFPGEDALSAAARFGLGMAAFGAGAGMPNPNEWVGRVPASARNITPPPPRQLPAPMEPISMPELPAVAAPSGMPRRAPGFEAPYPQAPPEAPIAPEVPAIPPRPAPSGLPQRAPGFEAPFPPLPEGSRAITDEASIATVKRLIQRAALSGMPRRAPGFEAPPLAPAPEQAPLAMVEEPFSGAKPAHLYGGGKMSPEDRERSYGPGKSGGTRRADIAAKNAAEAPQSPEPAPGSNERIAQIIEENHQKMLAERRAENEQFRAFSGETSPGPGITRYRLQPLDYDEMLRPRNPNAVKAAQQIAGLMRQGHEIQDMHVEPNGTLRFNLKGPAEVKLGLGKAARAAKGKTAPKFTGKVDPGFESSMITVEDVETPIATRSLAALPFKPAAGWAGSVHEEGSAFLSDGHMLLVRHGTTTPPSIQRYIDRRQFTKSGDPRVIPEKGMGEIFQDSVKKATEPARILGWLDPEQMDQLRMTVAVVKPDVGAMRAVDAQKLALAQKVTQFDSLRVTRSKQGSDPGFVVMYRGSDPVGVLMPIKLKVSVPKGD